MDSSNVQPLKSSVVFSNRMGNDEDDFDCTPEAFEVDALEREAGVIASPA